MDIGTLNKSAGFRGLLSGWGWTLFSGAIFGLLIYLTLLPFPHRPASIHLGANGCDLLREDGFTLASRPSGCVLHGAYRDGKASGFMSLRQGDNEIEIRLSEITAVRRESR